MSVPFKSGTYSLAMAFYNANGLRIARLVDTKKCRWLIGSKGDICTLTVKVDNVFLAGRYRISLAVRDESIARVDLIENIFFDVLPTLVTGSPARNDGVVHIESEWSSPKIV